MADGTVGQDGRVCTKCGEWKVRSEYFAKNARRTARCKKCEGDLSRARREKDAEHVRGIERRSYSRANDVVRNAKLQRGLLWRLSKRGLTVAQFLEMLASQGYCCAICPAPLRVSPKGRGSRESICMDHDHSSGAVRGLLCHACNTAIGLLKDDPVILTKAAAYLLERRDGKSPDRCGQ